MHPCIVNFRHIRSGTTTMVIDWIHLNFEGNKNFPCLSNALKNITWFWETLMKAWRILPLKLFPKIYDNPLPLGVKTPILQYNFNWLYDFVIQKTKVITCILHCFLHVSDGIGIISCIGNKLFSCLLASCYGALNLQLCMVYQWKTLFPPIWNNMV